MRVVVRDLARASRARVADALERVKEGHGGGGRGARGTGGAVGTPGVVADAAPGEGLVPGAAAQTSGDGAATAAPAAAAGAADAPAAAAAAEPPAVGGSDPAGAASMPPPPLPTAPVAPAAPAPSITGRSEGVASGATGCPTASLNMNPDQGAGGSELPAGSASVRLGGSVRSVGGGVAGSSAAADLVAGGEEEEGESRVAEDAQQPAPLWMMWRLLHARWVVCFSRV